MAVLCHDEFIMEALCGGQEGMGEYSPNKSAQ